MTLDDCVDQSDKTMLIGATDEKPDVHVAIKSYASLEEASRAWRAIHIKSRRNYIVISVPLTVGRVYAIIERKS